MVERIFSGLLVCVSALMLYLAWDYVAPIAYDPLGPRPYPLTLLTLLILTGLYLTLRPITKTNSKHIDTTDVTSEHNGLKNIIICTIALFAYGALFEGLGYVVATILMAWIIGCLFGGAWQKSLIASVLIAVSTYLLFVGLLEVKLPSGLLSFILG